MSRFAVVAMLAALIAAKPAEAQQQSRIIGAVTSNGTPVVAADIEVVNSGVRRIEPTRDDGRYSINVPAGTYTVRVRRIGFAPDSATNVVVAEGASVTVNFTLRATAVQVQGVTVIGYGTSDVRNNTGTVQAVTPADFNPGRVVSPEQLITAKVPGVQVIDNNEPGGGISIRIRGGTSVNASNEPLFVVDGVPLNVGGGLSSGRNPLNFLNPNDIKEVTVLRDASATAIYGSRGANGVVLITTKSGGGAEPAFQYSSNFSSSTIANRPDLLSAAQFRTAVTAQASSYVPRLGSANTNWLDLITRTAGGAEHNFAVSGAKDDMRYRLSLGLLNQDGILLGTNTQRVSGAASYRDVLLNDRLELSANFKGTRNVDAYTPGGVLGNAISMDPTQAPITGSNYFQYTNPLAPNNPLSDLALVQDDGVTYRSVGNLEAKWYFPIDGLTGTVRAGYDYATSERASFSPRIAQGDIETGRGGRIDVNLPTQVNTLLEVFGNYNRELGFLQSRLDLTGGYTFEEQTGDYSSFYAQNLSTDLLGQNAIPSAGETRPSVFREESRLISFFGRANWSIKDRYYVTASLRRDGSSRFGPENQWGIFPSFAAGWRIREEAFFPNTEFLSDLKLRFSWGVNGNQSFGNYLYVPTYTVSGAQAQYQFGNTFVPTLRPSAVDPNIKWEQTTSTNFGVDFGFLNDRITGQLDFYSKTTDDLIFRVPVPAGTTTGNFVTTNIGSMRNNGIELAVSAVVLDGRDGGIGYEASFAISTNDNEITRISNSATDRILTGGIAGGVGNTIQVLAPGLPINSFYVFEHKKGADGKPIGGNAAPLAMYVDQDNNGIINQDDLVAKEQPLPRWIIGHTSQVTYGNWEFSATARAYLGNYTYNNVASDRGSYSGLTLANGAANRHASILETQFVNPQYFSDYYLEDASFLRLDNVQAAYTFRNVAGARSIRVFGAIQNVFTITGYTGVDPLAGVNGIDNNLFPLSRTFTFGLNLAY